MILLALALALGLAQAAPPRPAGPAAPAVGERAATCVALSDSDPAAAVSSATAWSKAGGGLEAQHCLGLALSRQKNWAGAAPAFEAAATTAQTANDPRTADFWVEAANARLAAGDAAKARADFDAGLARNTLAGLQLGEAHLDRARAAVADGNNDAARTDIDAALAIVPDDPLAWLLSATLARRTGDLGRARRDMVEALNRGGDDPAVHLEAGNIAAASGDEAGAKAAWQRAVEIAPTSPQAASARAALAQFGAPK